MAITFVPYFIGLSKANGRVFLWLAYNLDDSCAYLSWMRQAASGSGKVLNLFTTDPQHGLAPNPFFWVLGRLAGILHLPLIFMYHSARFVCGVGLLLAIWEFLNLNDIKENTQKLAFLFVCFSSGLGWLPFFWNEAAPQPIDTWQPEAITFLSLYLSPLFCFSLALQVGIISLLLKAEKSGEIRFALLAGVCGFILGLAHTYDIVSISLVWSLYLIKQMLFPTSPSNRVKLMIQAACTGVMTLPAVAFIAYELRNEAVFQQRANVQTLSANIQWVFWGYGLTLVLAILGAVSSRFKPNKSDADTLISPIPWLLIFWAIANVAAAYLPTAFQRKMLQGSHIPIAILAGIGACWLYDRMNASRFKFGFAAYALIATLILSLTNIRFVLRDLDGYTANLAHTGVHRTYIQPGEVLALEWIEKNTAPGTPIQPLPWLDIAETPDGKRAIYKKDMAIACLTPGLTNRPVYCGHWGETPDYAGSPPENRGKLFEIGSLLQPQLSDIDRVELIKKMKVKYLLFSQKAAVAPSDEINSLAPIFRNQLPLPRYLTLRYSNPEADVYEFTPEN